MKKIKDLKNIFRKSEKKEDDIDKKVLRDDAMKGERVGTTDTCSASRGKKYFSKDDTLTDSDYDSARGSIEPDGSSYCNTPSPKPSCPSSNDYSGPHDSSSENEATSEVGGVDVDKKYIEKINQIAITSHDDKHDEKNDTTISKNINKSHTEKEQESTIDEERRKFTHEENTVGRSFKYQQSNDISSEQNSTEILERRLLNSVDRFPIVKKRDIIESMGDLNKLSFESKEQQSTDHISISPATEETFNLKSVKDIKTSECQYQHTGEQYMSHPRLGDDINDKHKPNLKYLMSSWTQTLESSFTTLKSDTDVLEHSTSEPSERSAEKSFETIPELVSKCIQTDSKLPWILRRSNPEERKTKGLNLCFTCGNTVYSHEQTGPIRTVFYHKWCLQCSICYSTVSMQTYRINNRSLKDVQLYCKNHQPR